MALITAAQARLYIRGLSGTAEDSNISTLVDRVDAMFASYLGYPVRSDGTYTVEDSTYVLYLDGDGTKELQLPVIPVVSVTSIYDDPELDYGSDDLVASGDYTLYGDSGLVILKNASTQGEWSATKRAIKATIVAGWATIPVAVQHAASLQVSLLWTGRDHVGRSKISQGGGSMDVARIELLPEVKRALDPYRVASAWLG